MSTYKNSLTKKRKIIFASFLIVLVTLFLILFRISTRETKNIANKQEVVYFKTMQNNLESYCINSLMKGNSGTQVKSVSVEFSNFIKKILDKLEEEITYSYGINEENGHEIVFGESWMSEEEEELVKEIRSFDSDNFVTVLSPSSLIDLESNSSLSEKSSPVEEYYFENKDNFYSQKSIKNQSKSAFIMITKKVGENDRIPPLPSWTKESYNHKDYLIKRKRLHSQFVGDFVNNKNNSQKPSEKNQEWIELEEFLGLEILFD